MIRLRTDVLCTRLTKNCSTQIQQGNRMGNTQEEAQAKLIRGLLELIVLQFLSIQPMHGYQIITKIRKNPSGSTLAQARSVSF
jgi:hypothetical protein